MLSREDNELLCRIGPGTPMGDLMRQYWVPAAAVERAARAGRRPCCGCACWARTSSAFRATSGAVGLIQNNCPHRGASLFYGRNEDEGLRCVYHGWKFDVSGPVRGHAERAAREHLQHESPRARPIPASSAAASIWAYLGRARRRRRCPTSSPTCWRAARFRSTSASATGCRRSRATSTPATRCSCTSGDVAADDTRARHVGALRAQPIAPRATRWPTRTSA